MSRRIFAENARFHASNQFAWKIHLNRDHFTNRNWAEFEHPFIFCEISWFWRNVSEFYLKTSWVSWVLKHATGNKVHSIHFYLHARWFQRDRKRQDVSISLSGTRLNLDYEVLTIIKAENFRKVRNDSKSLNWNHTKGFKKQDWKCFSVHDREILLT